MFGQETLMQVAQAVAPKINLPAMPEDRATVKVKDMIVGALLIVPGAVCLGFGISLAVHQHGYTLIWVGLGLFSPGLVIVDKEAVVGAVKALLGLAKEAKDLKSP